MLIIRYHNYLLSITNILNNKNIYIYIYIYIIISQIIGIGFAPKENVYRVIG